MMLLPNMTLRDVFGRSESGTPFELRSFKGLDGPGPSGPLGLGFGSIRTDIDRMDIDVSKFLGGKVYHPEDVEANPRTSANVSFHELIGEDSVIQDQVDDLSKARSEAERRFPYIKRFRNVRISPSIVKNKGGMGEFVFPDDPTNPNPGEFTITIGDKSRDLRGGIADTIIADMVHAASIKDKDFRA